jgi:hypothetical protein
MAISEFDPSIIKRYEFDPKKSLDDYVQPRFFYGVLTRDLDNPNLIFLEGPFLGPLPKAKMYKGRTINFRIKPGSSHSVDYEYLENNVGEVMFIYRWIQDGSYAFSGTAFKKKLKQGDYSKAEVFE